ncbi:Omp28-related outer membrane protein [bacterium]|nr:Omp28-related outer membrane protein [bacterium]
MRGILKFLFVTLVFLSCSIEEPHTGSYEISSVKLSNGTLLQNAVIFLNGDSLGVFPLPHTLTNLTVGTHNLKIPTTDGNLTESFTVSPDTKLSKNLEFIPTLLSVTALNSETNSEITEAEIYLDGILVEGKKTPALLQLEKGEHKIRVFKNEFVHFEESVNVAYQNTTNFSAGLVSGFFTNAVVEDFSNASCIPCVEANVFLKEVLEEDTSGRLFAIKYAVSWPQVTDPFFQANPSENAARYTYYNILQAPTTIVNGTERPSSISKTEIKQKIAEAQNKINPLSIEVTSQLTGTNFKVDASLKLIKSVSYTDLKLFFVLVEKLVTFDEAPGSNGETQFREVMRDLQPNGDGLPVTLVVGETKNQSYTFDVSQWETDQLECLVFVQSQSTRTILQTGSSLE